MKKKKHYAQKKGGGFHFFWFKLTRKLRLSHSQTKSQIYEHLKKNMSAAFSPRREIHLSPRRKPFEF